MYEKDSCYLAEASTFLSQAVIYEIPGVRKQIAKQEKYLTELEKLEESGLKKVSEVLASRNADCSRISIKGDHPKKEVSCCDSM